MGNFICEYCLNKDPRYLGNINGKIYCRKCIRFRGENVEAKETNFVRSPELFLDYELSDKQRDISKSIVEAIANKKDVLVHAVCGAGKTELVFDVIKLALKNKGKVGFTIPRKDVVIELYERFQNAFRNNKVVSVYGGNSENLDGDIILLTTHQLYRYKEYFDLLIIDEIDAFPFRDNEILNTFFKRSVKGNYIVLTATPSDKLLEEFSSENKVKFELLTRFHEAPIPVPAIKRVIGVLKYFYVYSRLKEYFKSKKKALIFVPTIDQGKRLFSFLKLLVKRGENVSSKSEKRKEIIHDFKEGKYDYLVTTSILERGVTIPNLQVIIFNSDHEVYDSATLIQISGRVGRKKEYPDGEVIFLANKKTLEQTKAIENIKHSNTFL